MYAIIMNPLSWRQKCLCWRRQCEIKSIRLESECLLIKGNACFHYNSETVGVERLGKYLLKRQHFCFVLYCDMTLSYRSLGAAHNLALSNK